MTIDIGGVLIKTDPEGYLEDPADWSEDAACELARTENVELGEDHWKVIRFMRAFHEEHQVAADVRHVTRHLKEEHGKEDARKLLFDLFPYGYVKQACKIAGMRKPRGWSTG